DPVPIVEILAVVPPPLQIAAGSNRAVLGIDAGREADWSFAVLCPARGRFDLGTLHIRVWDRSGLVLFESRQTVPKPISVYPQITPIRHVPRPVRSQFSFGNYVSPRLG